MLTIPRKIKETAAANETNARAYRDLLQAIDDWHTIDKIFGALGYASGRFQELSPAESDPYASLNCYKALAEKYPGLVQESQDLEDGHLLEVAYSAYATDFDHIRPVASEDIFESADTGINHMAIAGGKLQDFSENGTWPMDDKKDIKWLHMASNARLKLAEFWEALRAARILELERINTGTDKVTPTARVESCPEIKLISLNRTDREHYSLVFAEKKELEAAEEAIDLKRKASKMDIGLLASGSTGPETASKKKKTLSARQKAAAEEQAKLMALNTPDVYIEHLQGFFTDAPDTPEPSPTTSEHPDPAYISLNKNGLKVFQRLWPHDSLDYSGTIRWPAFERAMKQAGCTMKTVDGSEFSFAVNDRAGIAKRVVIDRPHGGSSAPIEDDDLTSWGKRITQWIGWKFENFKLADRTATDEQDDQE